MTIHAFTELHNSFPAFINLSEQPDGTIKVSVRTRGNDGKDYATITLTALQAEELADSIYKHNYKGEGEIDLNPTAAPVPASEAANVPDEIRAIAEQMRSQDNECTANPLFHVEQRRTITGIDTDYDPEIVWCIEDSMIFKGDEEFAALESAYEESGAVPENYTRTGYVHEWEFVTAFFTRSAAEQFVTQHAHKYSGPLRMSVETEPRNWEMKLVRDFLQSLAAPAAPTDAKPTTIQRQAVFAAFSECLTAESMLPQEIADKLIAAANTAAQSVRDAAQPNEKE